MFKKNLPVLFHFALLKAFSSSSATGECPNHGLYARFCSCPYIHHTLPADVDSGQPVQAHNEFEKLHTYGKVIYFISPIKGGDKIVAWHCGSHHAAIHLAEIYKQQSSFLKAAAQNLYLWNLKEN